MEEKIAALVESLYDKGYAGIENFLDKKEANELLLVLQEKEMLLKAAGIGRQEEHKQIKEIRGDKIHWLEKGEDETIDKLFFEAMEKIQLAVNRRCFLGLNNYEFHFAKYEPGSFYKRHKDIFTSNDARKISLIIYLNTQWKEGDGGELKIYTKDKDLSIQPKAGTIVLFESHIEHEVMISHTNRYSITGWLKSEKFVL